MLLEGVNGAMDASRLNTVELSLSTGIIFKFRMETKEKVVRYTDPTLDINCQNGVG